MKYDDASWHVGSVELAEGEDDPYPAASGHIVAYLQWCLRRGWAGDELRDEPDAMADLERTLSGEGTFYDFFATWMDCKFTAEDLSEDAAAFTTTYYESTWFDDVMAIAGDCVYTVSGDQYPLAEINQRLDAAYEAWKADGGVISAPRAEEVEKPWWKFW